MEAAETIPAGTIHQSSNQHFIAERVMSEHIGAVLAMMLYALLAVISK